eukprot:jgi/Hompol1/4497/HPOL_001785-RA
MSTFFGPRCHLTIFATGTLKNITNCTANQSHLARIGGVETFGLSTNALDLDNSYTKTNNDAGTSQRTDVKSKLENETIQACQLMVQICGVLRNLSSCSSSHSHFLEPIKGSAKRTIELLIEMMDRKHELDDVEELMLGISRILSKLSMDKACIQHMRGKSQTAAFMNVAIKFQSDPLLRLVANLALEDKCGSVMIEMVEIESLVDMLGGIHAFVLTSMSLFTKEELVLNLLGALANLTFYMSSESLGLIARAKDILKGLVPMLIHDNNEIVIEACRICANLSRIKSLSGFDETREPAVVYQVCGTLMNLAKHPRASTYCQTVIENNGEELLREVFERSIADEQWDIATVAAQALYNLLSVGGSGSLKDLNEMIEDAVGQIDADAETNQDSMSQPKRIVICGGSAAGATVAIQLQKQFTANDIHITIVDKLEKRFNIFATPRGFVQPDFANKQFVGWDKFFSKPGIGEFVHGRVAAVHASEIELENGTKLPFDFLVFATGSSYLSILPNSANSSSDVLAILHKVADGIKSASKVVIVGAGAVGIEVAAEIRSQYPDKKVTLIHSQLKLAVGATSKSFHDRTLAAIKKLGIDLVLGDPVTSANYPSGFAIGPNTVTTKSGAVFDSDLTIFSTGFGTPNSEAIKSLQVDKPLLDDRGYVLVKSTLQLEDSRFPNILSLGNVAATGAVPTAIAAKA